jgi:hypothetical protein
MPRKIWQAFIAIALKRNAMPKKPYALALLDESGSCLKAILSSAYCIIHHRKRVFKGAKSFF